MSQKQTHIIDRQIFDLHFTSEAVAKQAQRDIQDMHATQLAPMINGLLDTWFNPAEVVSISKLELDLGNIHISDGAEVWMQKIKKQLEEKLLPFANNKQQLEQDFYARKQTIKDHLLEAFTWFLKFGYIHPASVFENLDAVKKELLLMDHQQQAELKKMLLILPETTVLQRLTANVDQDELAFFLQVFQPGISLKQWLSFLINATKELHHKSFALKQNVSAVNTGAKKIEQQFLQRLLEKILECTRTSKNIDIKQAEEIQQEVLKKWQKDLTDDLLLEHKITTGISKVEAMDFSSEDDVGSIWIDNAGLCLLYPWLNTFFETLGICKAGAFVNKEMQEHAIYLLHYVASKEENATEEKLLFPKMLCGWPWQMPCINNKAITEEEKAETDSLLQAVIDHWKVLKQTSVDGLREAFLQRGGNLIKKGDHYLLQPEQQGIDVLIEHIPWGFRNILLPWMTTPVVVEWY